jgi:hypothetical protein
MQFLSMCDLWPTGRGVCWSPDLSLLLPQSQTCPIPYGMTQGLLSLLPHYPHTQMCSQDLHPLIQSSPVGLASHDPWDSQIQCNQISWLKQEKQRFIWFKVNSSNTRFSLHDVTSYYPYCHLQHISEDTLFEAVFPDVFPTNTSS